MLGMVFTELIEMVEDKFSPEIADKMIEAAEDEGGGVYTAVGAYPAEHVQVMVGRLADLTGIPANELVRVFGRHLLGRFAESHPGHFQRHPDVFDFLARIDWDIHVEVKKLYSNATLPRFEVLSRSADILELRYTSPRRLELLALGLIEQLGEFAGQPLQVTVSPDDKGCTFAIAKVDKLSEAAKVPA